MLSQSLDLDLNQKDTQAMIQHVTDFFNIIKQGKSTQTPLTAIARKSLFSLFAGSKKLRFQNQVEEY